MSTHVFNSLSSHTLRIVSDHALEVDGAYEHITHIRFFFLRENPAYTRNVGNIAKERRDSTTKRDDLITPTLKAEHYTTGRGGTGNIAKNDPTRPEIARAAQDVEGPPPREPEGKVHYGRGGAANIASKDGKEEIHRKPSPEGDKVKKVEEKGKGFLEKIVGKK